MVLLLALDRTLLKVSELRKINNNLCLKKDPEEQIDKLKQELNDKEVAIRDYQEKIVQQQAVFLEAIKVSENVIRSVVTDLQGSPTPSRKPTSMNSL